MKDVLSHYRLVGSKVELKRFDPAARPLSAGESEEEDRARTAELSHEMALFQDHFYALHKEKLLIVLQGMDTSGKDGTIRAVFQAIDPLGVRAVSYRAPTDPEKQRDFLWRHHRDVPGVGEVVIFNRSHYEAVLIEYVHGWIDEDERRLRLKHINRFERLLADTGTTIVKFFLHISKDEQRRRLQERIDEPHKNWKFNAQDLQERKLWDAYQRAYEVVLSETGTKHAPWYVVPSDSKTHRNVIVSHVLLETLKRLAPKPPPGIKSLAGTRVR